jgi:ATP-dependent Clp protease ATP-binding subunit ClpC
MTSNLGARFLDKKGHIGFAAQDTIGIPQKVEENVLSEVKRAFNPEFLNRLDEVILFTSLVDEDLLKIVHLMVDQLNKNLEPKQIKIRLAEDAAKYILEKTLTDRSYGARPLRRALQKYVEDPLSEAVIQGSIARPSELEVYLGDSGLFVRPVGEEQPVAAGDIAAEPPKGTVLYAF